MSKIVYTYFDKPGRGEPCRLLLAYGGEEFEDRRIAEEDWPALKPRTPFGQLPTIDFDGKQYAQSQAIARYFGRRYGLAGDTLEEDHEIDQNVDLVYDLRTKAAEVARGTDEAIKDAQYADLAKNLFPDSLERISAVIRKNNGHIALGKLTWGDFVVAGFFDSLTKMLRMPDLGKQYPAIQELTDNVNSLPKIKAFYAA